MGTRSLKEQLLALQSAVQRLQLGNAPPHSGAGAAMSSGSPLTAGSLTTPVPSATAPDEAPADTPGSGASVKTVSCFASGDGCASEAASADSVSAVAGGRSSSGDSPALSSGSVVSPPPAMAEQPPMEGTPRPPPRSAGFVRRRPDTPVPAPRPPGGSNIPQPMLQQQPTRPGAKLRPPGLPRKRLLDGSSIGEPPPPQLPAAADAPASRIPQAALTATPNNGSLTSGPLRIGHQSSPERPYARVTAVPAGRSGGLAMATAHRWLSAIPEPKNLTTTARRVTAPDSAEKAQLTGAAGGTSSGLVAAAAKAWVDRAGGDAVAGAKPRGSGMASRLIRFARGGGKGSSVADAPSESSESGESANMSSERQSDGRPDVPQKERRRSLTLMALQRM